MNHWLRNQNITFRNTFHIMEEPSEWTQLLFLHPLPAFKDLQFCQLFSTVLKIFCPVDSKNVFGLVLPHLEPKLELFEVDDIGDDGDDD